jgi:hypothetical protein
MRWAFDRRAGAAAFAVIALRSGGARAAGGDSSYGRIDRDVVLAAGAGIAVVPGGVRPDLDVRLRYLDTAGIFVTYEDGPMVRSESDPVRVLTTGLEVRPLFLIRWLKGLETSDARFDLAVDSIGLEIGAAFLQPPAAAFAATRGLEVGLGIELPILTVAAGPWVRLQGGLRWSDGALASGQVRGPEDRSAYLAITLAWHQPIASHAVDVGDHAP